VAVKQIQGAVMFRYLEVERKVKLSDVRRIKQGKEG
jgi:hypothetical protein